MTKLGSSDVMNAINDSNHAAAIDVAIIGTSRSRNIIKVDQRKLTEDPKEANEKGNTKKIYKIKEPMKIHQTQ